jgi:hypothetical protein
VRGVGIEVVSEIVIEIVDPLQDVQIQIHDDDDE